MALNRTRALKRRRLYLVLGGVVVLALAAALVLNAFRDTVMFFFSPSEVEARLDDPELKLETRRFRLGGLVADGSVRQLEDGITTAFVVTDGAGALKVRYTGILPALFREGQGVVAEGRLQGGDTFVADEVLAKHDENYMPPEVAEALRKTGHWEGKGDGKGGNGYGNGNGDYAGEGYISEVSP